MFSSNFGPAESDVGGSFVRVAKAQSGNAVYGPYTVIEPGQYAVTFRVEIEDREGAETPICAVVDITTQAGKRYIAFQRILADDLSDGRFVINFTTTERLEGCEYRLFATGGYGLKVYDEPTLGQMQNAPADLASDVIRPDVMRALWDAGINVTPRKDEIAVQRSHFHKFAGHILRVEQDRAALARQVVTGVGYRGLNENSLFRAFVGTDRPLAKIPTPVPFTSSLCHQTHFGYEQYRFWAHALKEQPKYQRKQWEFVFIAQTLFERGFLTSGKQGIVFGAGEEQLPALFASFGVKILATDQPMEGAIQSGWATSGQYSHDLKPLNQRHICTDRMFNELVSFEPVDMNHLPASLNNRFDFCWSACALEHLGSLEHGLAFIESSMRTLKPGGIAIHTTEFNITSNEDTLESEGLSIYRRRDIEDIVSRLTLQGYIVSPIDWELGEGFAEMVVDLAPYLELGEPHIRLRIGQYDCTSIALIIEKPSSDLRPV